MDTPRCFPQSLLLVVFNACLVAGQPSVTGSPHQRTIIAQVDERVELLSIVFRLAGNQEYSGRHLKSYVEAIHRHFAPYRSHSVVLLAEELARERGVGFDAVMAMAVHLQPPPSLQPILPFTEQVPETRWGAEQAAQFSTLLQQFYREADCEAFFKQHQRLYQVAATRFALVLEQVNFSWYQDFYGQIPEGSFRAIIGLGNGGGNYGPKVILADGKEELYAIMGTWRSDSLGLPVYESTHVLPTIIHEFNHSFVNPLIDEHATQLQPAGSRLFLPVSGQMRAMAYGSWQTMLCEALVRAAVIAYLERHERDLSVSQNALKQEIKSGFWWMGELVNLVRMYQQDRRKYPTLKIFMPQVVHFYSQLASKVKNQK